MTTDARRLGVVYTPAAIARPVVERTLAPLLAGAAAADIRALRICDPAMGDGAFLREVLDALAAAAPHVPRRELAEHCLFGVDIDPAAIARARHAIAEATGADPARLAANLRVADALAPGTWSSGERFDAVVGNPPYVRQERLTDKSALRGFATYDGVADLYVYFVELAHRLVRDGGRYGLIVPDKWLTAAYGRPLRQFLAERGSLEGIVDFGRALRVFAGADAFPCVVWGTVGGARDSRIAALAVDDAARGLAAIADPPTDAHVSRARWTAEPWHIDAPADAALIDALERRFPAFGSVYGRPARGVVTGCNAAFVLDRASRDALLEREPAAARVIRAFVKGRDLRPWRALPTTRWLLVLDHGIELDELPHVAAHVARFRDRLEPRPPHVTGRWAGRKPGRYRWFELQDPVGALAVARAPRLLIQDIQSAPVCCLDPGELVPDTTVWMLPTADPFVAAVLSSPLYWWYARRRFPPALGGAVRPKHAYLARLPLPDPDPAARARIAALAEARLAARAADDTRELDRAIADAVHDAYELTAADRRSIATTPAAGPRSAAGPTGEHTGPRRGRAPARSTRP